MSTTPSTKAVRAPGRLVVGPTNLAGAYPYGGSVLGTAQLVTLDIGERESPPFRAEELAGQAFDGLYMGADLFATATLTQWTEDTVNAAGLRSSAGTGTVPAVTYPHASAPAPVLQSSRGVVLLFVPEAIAAGGSNTDEKGLAWILYRARPMLTKPIVFTGFRGPSLFVAWEALPNDSGAVAKIASFGDLSL